MRRCKCCRKEFQDQHFEPNHEYHCGDWGRDVGQTGVLVMGYGSRHDGNKYKFTLVSGWYCWDCLDREVDQNLCQPLVVYRRDGSGAMDDIRIRRYRVKGLEHEAE